MKKAHPIKPIPIGQFITQTWRVAIKPPRRSVQTPAANRQRRLLRHGEPEVIVCGFCGNTIRVLVCATAGSANRGGRR